MILLTNAISTPLYKAFDPVYFLKVFAKKYIEVSGKTNITQLECNQIFEGHYVDLAENFAYVTRTLYLSCWYGSVAPLGLVFSMVGLVFNYWLDKYLLLRMYSLPPNQNEKIIYKVVDYLELIAFLYLFGACEYTRRIIVSTNLVDYLYSFVLYGVTSAALMFVYIVYLILWKNKVTKQVSDMKYEDAFYLFLTDYDRMNPLTQ